MNEDSKVTLMTKFRRIIQMSVVNNQDPDTKIMWAESFNKQLSELKEIALSDGLILEDWSALLLELKIDIRDFLDMKSLIAA